MKKVDAFWDTSAIVPLCVAQANSGFAREALKSRSVAVWWATPLEAMSALSRLARAGEMDRHKFQLAANRLARLRQMWIEVLPSEGLRQLAEDLVQRHPLRAADALQLAAALIWSGGRARKSVFVCLDQCLADAAGKEGFAVQAVQ